MNMIATHNDEISATMKILYADTYANKNGECLCVYVIRFGSEKVLWKIAVDKRKLEAE